MKSAMLRAVLLLPLLFGAVRSDAQLGWPTTILSSRVFAFNQFGAPIAIDADRMVVGSPRGGVAEVYRWDGAIWSLEADLRGNDSDELNNLFGSSVAIEGDLIVVGARDADVPPFTRLGAAWVFRRGPTGWEQEAKLVPPNGSNDFRAGNVALNAGRVAMVGGFGASRAVNVFRRELGSWVHEQRIATDNVNRQFGSSIALDGETLCIASIGTVGVSGVAQVYRRSGTVWSLAQTITPSGLNFPEAFGQEVALESKVMVFGCPNETACLVYRLVSGTWAFDGRIVPPGGFFNFGSRVDVRGDTIASSSQRLVNGQLTGGRVHVFERRDNLWKSAGIVGDAGTLTPESLAIGPWCVAIGQPTFAVAGDLNAGRVQIFSRSEGKWIIGPTPLVGPPSGSPPTQGLGVSVAVAGGLVVSGSFLEDNGATDAGRVRTFVRDGTHLTDDQIVGAPVPAATDYFGRAVAASLGPNATSMLVGAPLRDVGGRSNQGVAYFFPDFRSSVNVATLAASDGTVEDTFGFSVGLSAGTAVVGATGDDTGGIVNHGSAYVFDVSRTGATQVAKLLAPDPAAADNFGYSVAIDQSTIVVGAFGRSGQRGAAFVYQRRSGSVWDLAATLTAPDAAPGDSFGVSVAVRGDCIVVGAHTKAVGANAGQGTVYVFARSGAAWVPAAKLTASDGAAGDSFGVSVAASERNIAVGAFLDDVAGFTDAGSVYVFTTASGLATGPWADERKFTRLAPAAADYLGFSVGADGSTVAAGALLARGGLGEVLMVDLADTQQDTVVFGPTNTPAASVEQAIRDAASGARVLASAGALAATDLNLTARPVEVVSRSSMLLPWWSSVALADGASLRAGGTSPIDVFGSVETVSDSGRSEIHADAITFWPSASLILGAHQLRLTAPSASLLCPVSLLPSSLLSSSGDLRFGSTLNALAAGVITAGRSIEFGGVTNLRGSTVQAGSEFIVRGTANLTAVNVGASLNRVLAGATLNFGGLLSGPTQNDGKLVLVGFTGMYGGFTNSAGATTNLAGSGLSIFGPYVNNGTVVGAPGGCANCLSTPPGLTVEGTMHVGPDATTLLGGVIEIGGGFDSEATAPASFDLRQATLRLNAAGLVPQRTFEVMGRDYGPAEQALARAPDAFVIGTLEIGPVATVVRLADQRDNSPGTALEAIYAERLVIHAGSRLVTGGLQVYARSVEIAGEVDAMENIHVLGPACPADLWIDCRVDDSDFFAFVGPYDLMDCADPAMPVGCEADINDDGFVDDADFSIFATAYDALLCP